jgi:hypothetical protein
MALRLRGRELPAAAAAEAPETTAATEAAAKSGACTRAQTDASAAARARAGSRAYACAQTDAQTDTKPVSGLRILTLVVRRIDRTRLIRAYFQVLKALLKLIHEVEPSISIYWATTG